MPDNTFTRLEDLIASQFPGSTAASALATIGTPSASIAVLASDGIKSHAIASSASPIHTSTLFQACSISKPIQGLAVLRTIEQGKLSLSDPITKHLPSSYLEYISTPQTKPLLSHVTILNLLTHTGGTTVGGFNGYPRSSIIPDIQTILSGASPSNSPQIRLSRLPGLKFRYSGGGSTILQAILESTHSKPLPQIVHELVFEPLGMTRSFYNTMLPADEKNMASCFDTGFTPCPEPYHVLPEMGAAGIWTTPHDLLIAHTAIRDCALGRSSFISSALAKEALTTVAGAFGFSAGGWATAKGWFGHSGGNQPGFRCETMMFYDREGSRKLGIAAEEGVAVMTNSALGTDVCWKIMHAIGYLRGWPGAEARELGNGLGGQSVPLADRKADTGGWHDWEGSWELIVDEDEKQMKAGLKLSLEEDTDGLPAVMMEHLPRIRLLRAAISPTVSGKADRPNLCLVVDGLDVMLELGYDEGGKPRMELWPGFNEGVYKCRMLG
jgi:CubicO group peptidase (beta-lactamase class C family)